MSELTTIQNHGGGFRHTLLTNVSVLALLGASCMPSTARTADAGQPTVWIELGGQLERVDSAQSAFEPPFFDVATPSVLDSMLGAQRPSRYSTGADGKVTLIPRATEWVFSAAVRYGRARNKRHLHYQTPGLPSMTGTNRGNPVVIAAPRLKAFGDGQANLGETHFVLDFQAGKDVGLGLFGGHASSVVSVGVRYAQFTASSEATLYARPLYYFGPPVQVLGPGTNKNTRPRAFRQTNTAVIHSRRNSHSVGPSASWNASMPIVTREDSPTLTFDWGVNAAFLFGRQYVDEDYHTNGVNLTFSNGAAHTFAYAHATAHTRSRAVTIPNVGGFAGVSLKFPSAKVSLGYRGDFFFNASDIGIDAHENGNRNFYGPYATISIGLGG